MHRQLLALLLGANGLAAGEPLSVAIIEPAGDRWMYPANGTPGTRAQASTFSALPNAGGVEDRFGQFIFKFDTAAAGISAGLGAENYHISSISVTATIGQDRLFLYDPTQDSRYTYGQMALPDDDLGRPLELHGTGFRNGFSSETFQENSAFSGGDPLERNAFALGFDASATPRDVSNNVTEDFPSQAWAIGKIDELPPGSEVVQDTIVRFTIDLTVPGVSGYVREGLDRGFIWLTLSSLHPALQQGGEFVAYYTKDSAVHGLFGDAAPTLDLTWTTPSGFTSFSRNPIGRVSLGFFGQVGISYILQASTDLTENSWQDLTTFSPATSGTLSWQENSPQPKRFFRISSTPITP